MRRLFLADEHGLAAVSAPQRDLGRRWLVKGVAVEDIHDVADDLVPAMRFVPEREPAPQRGVAHGHGAHLAVLLAAYVTGLRRCCSAARCHAVKQLACIRCGVGQRSKCSSISISVGPIRRMHAAHRLARPRPTQTRHGASCRRAPCSTSRTIRRSLAGVGSTRTSKRLCACHSQEVTVQRECRAGRPLGLRDVGRHWLEYRNTARVCSRAPASLFRKFRGCKECVPRRAGAAVREWPR